MAQKWKEKVTKEKEQERKQVEWGEEVENGCVTELM